jgi:prephenate dehydrogenase
MKYSVGIIGGKGIMGSFFRKIFEKNNVKTFIWSRSSKLSLRDFCSLPDIIMISVPIDKTIDIIKKVASFINNNQCICDITSIKKSVLDEMKKSNKPYFGMHPMFAPPISGLMNGQNIIFCSGNALDQEIFFKNIFKKEKAVLLQMTGIEHDKIMSIVQGLSHFLDICFIQTLHRANIDLDKIFASRSPAYALKMMLAGRTLAQDSNLYGNIQIKNAENLLTLKNFFEESEKLFDIIKNKDLKKFSALFNNQKFFLGEYAIKSQKESDKVIDFLSKKIIVKNDKKIINTNITDDNYIGVLGPKYTFSYIAAKKFFGDKKKILLYNNIPAIFSAYKKMEISKIFVPIENILHGSVVESLDGICNIKIPIQAVYEMTIVPAMFVNKGQKLDSIKEIFSHSQAIAQCKNFIEKNFLHCNITVTSSTSHAIEKMKKTIDSIAIAPVFHEQDESIEKIHVDIANSENNATRFAYLSNTKDFVELGRSSKQEGALMFSFKDNDSPGNLEKVLHIFSSNDINLTKIESRPTGKYFGDYIFFITYIGIIKDKERFIKKLNFVTSDTYFLGEFPIY